MKARGIGLTINTKNKRIIEEYTKKQIEDGICKSQWLMLLAFNRVLGIGEKRIIKVMQLYSQLIDEYKGFQKDDIADEQLEKSIKKILPKNFKQLYI